MFASLYQYFYLIIVIIMTFSIMSSYCGCGYIKTANQNISNRTGLFFTALCFIMAIGLRPMSRYFVDMLNYNTDYIVFHYGTPFTFNWNLDNFLFDNLFAWMGSMMFDIRLFFLLIAAIYFGCMAWACAKIFPYNSLLAFVVYLGAFSTFSYGTNGIKAGAAASIFLLALAYRKNKLLVVFFLCVSLGFHHSMMAPIVAFVMAYFYRKPKVYLWGWIVCLILAAAHVTYFMSLFSGYTDEQGAGYLAAGRLQEGVSGFRPDFILYSAVPIFVGYNLIKKKYIESDFYNFLWCTYTMTNCVFLLCTYGTFINRIAYLSWLMYPIVLLYPFVNTDWAEHPKTSNRYLKYAVYGHLAFTVFMAFVYYA